MQTPVKVTFKDIPPSDAIQQDVWSHAEELEQFHGRITACHVVVSAPHRHSRKGRLYSVRVELSVPGEMLVVNRGNRKPATHEDVHLAIRDAFRAARRRLEDHARRRRGQVKRHDPAPHGRVARVLPDEDHGFILTPDGRELYFHRNGLLDAELEELQPGTRVRFHESAGRKGAVASSVHVAGRHNQPV